MAMQLHHDTTSKKFTPPGSFTKAPLTPPLTDTKPSKRVARILRFLRHQKSGRSVSETPWLALKLQPGEYDELLRLLKNDESLWVFTETKVRYDYDSTTRTFVIRMPTQLHEVFIVRVVKEIECRLRAIADSETPSRSFAQKIKHNGSGRLIFQSAEDDDNQTTIKREPDAEFKHDDAHWPGVVIEVSYSQKTKALPRLADNYILETDGNIRVVVGLDLDYNTKKATVSMWRPQYLTTQQGELELVAAQTVERQIFRDELGNANLAGDAGLRLDLRDFAHHDLPEVLGRDLTDSFLIDSVTLCRCLDEAEEEEREAKQKKRFIAPLQQGARKRYRTTTPPEELGSEDERKFEDDERRVRARVSNDDSSYKSSAAE